MQAELPSYLRSSFRWCRMTISGLHDILTVSSAVLPVLYVPVVLLLLDKARPGAGDPDRSFAWTLLGYICVFANAEIASIFGLHRVDAAGRSTWPASVTGALLGLIALAVVLGIALSLGPAGDLLFSPNGDRARTAGQWFGMTVAVIFGMALPCWLVAWIMQFHAALVAGVLVLALVMLMPTLVLCDPRRRRRVEAARKVLDGERAEGTVMETHAPVVPLTGEDSMVVVIISVALIALTWVCGRIIVFGTGSRTGMSTNSAANKVHHIPDAKGAGPR